MAFAEDAVLTAVRAGVLLVTPETEPVQPRSILGTFLVAASASTTSDSELLAADVVPVAAVVLGHVPVVPRVGLVGDDAAGESVLLRSSFDIIGVRTGGDVADGTDAVEGGDVPVVG